MVCSVPVDQLEVSAGAGVVTKSKMERGVSVVCFM